jgi:flagellar basal body P-ring formation protein FlgA
MKLLHVMFGLVLGFVGITASHGRQDLAPVNQAVEDYLRIQTQGLPGEISFTIGNLDPNNQLPPCSSMEVSLPPGARAWGRIHVAVRCLAPETWSLFVAAQVRVIADYLVAAHPLVQGQTVTGADLAQQRGDLAELPAGILTDQTQAIGRTASLSIVAGRPLRADMLRQPLLIRQNQAVRIVSRGAGFQVASEGKALNQGSEGEVIQVRLANGQVVSGLARAGGIVEVGY